MSARRPKGTRKVADARRYAVATQFRETASRDRLAPIVGRAIFIEDEVKGVRNELIMAIKSTTFLLTSAAGVIFGPVISYFVLSLFGPITGKPTEIALNFQG